MQNQIFKTEKISIADILYDNITRDQTLDLMECFVIIGRKIGRSHVICTPNAQHVVLASVDHEFSDTVAHADLIVSDGMAIIYASRFLGTPLQQLIGGRLLLPEFAARAASRGYRVFLLGGKTEAIAQQAIKQLCTANPGLIIESYTPPFMDEFDEAETQRMLEAVHCAKPDVVFVCLGTPKQEKWIARNRDRLSVPVSLGVGSALDIIAGQVRQPPRWMTEVGLEWLAKLFQEPKRLWRRYLLESPPFFMMVAQQRMRARRAPDSMTHHIGS